MVLYVLETVLASFLLAVRIAIARRALAGTPEAHGPPAPCPPPARATRASIQHRPGHAPARIRPDRRAAGPADPGCCLARGACAVDGVRARCRCDAGFPARSGPERDLAGVGRRVAGEPDVGAGGGVPDRHADHAVQRQFTGVLLGVVRAPPVQRRECAAPLGARASPPAFPRPGGQGVRKQPRAACRASPAASRRPCRPTASPWRGRSLPSPSPCRSPRCPPPPGAPCHPSR